MQPYHEQCHNWLYENMSTDDIVPGAFYNNQNGQWVIYDLELTIEFITENI